jgi:NADPH:quinone reductase-like Zn-dependent oxidoreductase
LFQDLPATAVFIAPKSGSVVLIWGGSSSVGCSAIQLARAAGVEVITTASKHNFELCKSLGADHVFDRNSESVTDDVVRAQGKTFGALNAIGVRGTVEACIDIVSKSEGKQILVTTLPIFWPLDRKAVEVKMVSCHSSFICGIVVLVQNLEKRYL